MITKEIAQLATITKKNEIQTFSDFLDYALWCFGVPIKNWGYDKGVGIHFYETFNDLIQDYSKGIKFQGWCDPLGDTFMELIKGIARFRGAFFTPDSVCRLMSEITIDTKQRTKKRLCGVFGYRNIINDPTCGSARNLLAAKAQYEKEPESEQPYFIGEDIDPLCVKMSAINMCVHGCLGEVICHDTLAEPDHVKFGYIINIGLRFGYPPSINYSEQPMMFELCTMRHPQQVAQQMNNQTDKQVNIQKEVISKEVKEHSEPRQLSLF